MSSLKLNHLSSSLSPFSSPAQAGSMETDVVETAPVMRPLQQSASRPMACATVNLVTMVTAVRRHVNQDTMARIVKVSLISKPLFALGF